MTRIQQKLRVLDLFSGIGGFSYGLESTGGFETVAFCEIEEYPRRVLAKHWPDVPCFEDVRKLGRKDIDGTIDVICGGYPCQPFSHAGEQKGEEDDRHLWPEVDRILDEFRPAWFIGENVAGHINLGLDNVLSDLADKGYAARVFNIPACSVGAFHKRERIWILANSSSNGWEQGTNRKLEQANSERASRCQQKRGIGCASSEKESGPDPNPDHARQQSGSGPRESDGQARDNIGRLRKNVSNTDGEGSQGRLSHEKPDTKRREKSGERRIAECGDRWDWGRACRWEAEPGVGRVANGISRRVDRIKGLGNAVVPVIPKILGHAILEAHNDQ